MDLNHIDEQMAFPKITTTDDDKGGNPATTTALHRKVM